MTDGTQVGSAYIEITPEISRPGLKKAQRDISDHLKQMAKAAEREFSRQQREVVGGFNKQIKAMQRGQTSGVFAEIRAEMTSYQKLQKQLQQADKDRLRAFEIEKKKIAESMSAQKALQKQKLGTIAAEKKALEAMGKAESEAYSIERKRIEAIQKAEVQAYQENIKRQKLEQQDQARRIGELSKWYDKKQALEKADQDAAAKAAKQAQSDMDKAFKYRTMRGLGATPEAAAAYATGQSPAKVAGDFPKLSSAAKASSATVNKAIEGMSHHLSQLSTRIGLASFQLQLLGGFATTFISGPAALGLGMMAQDGLKFAASIGYARASMESLLGPSTDVEKILADIRKMAIESPLFNTEDAISYAQKLASVGVKGDDLYKSMQALSNIFLTQGVAGPERANLALMAYTQILSKGAIGMDDLRQQFAEHVPGGMKIFEEVAKRMGYKTIKSLSDAMKDGEVSAAQLNAEFIKFGNTKKFVEGATKSSETLGGVWQAFQEEMQATLGMAFDANRKEIIAAINGIRPVVKDFINWLVKSLPAMLNWLNRVVEVVRKLKWEYDLLTPGQKEMIRQLTLLTLAAGPTAIAIGILGTALSAAANAASLFMKALALVGMGASAGWIITLGAALVVLGGAMVYLYQKSEPFRKQFLQVINLLKDAVETMLLPAVDLLVGAVRSLGRTFSDFGLKSEHLAYIVGLLIIPIAMLTLGALALWAAIKIVQAVVLVLASALYAVLHVFSGLLWVVQKLAEGIALLPWTSDDNKRRLEGFVKGVDGARQGMEGFVDVQGKWKNLTTTGSDATEGLRTTLANTDLTVSGLTGGFDLLNAATQRSIDKQITLEDAVNNARAAMIGQNNVAGSAVDASDNYNRSLTALKDSIDRNKKSLNDKTKAGQENRQSLKTATQASYEMMLQDIRSGVPMQEAINKHKARTEALKKEFGKNKETQAAAQKLIDTYGKVPPDVQTLLGLMGYKDISAKMQEILAAQKVAANPSIRYADALRTERKAWDKASNWRTGGYIANGPGTTTSDSIFAKLSRKEFVVNAEATKQVGPDVLGYINKTGQLPLPAFAKGGPVQWPVNFDVSKTKFPEMLGGDPSGGGVGWMKMMTILRQHFPGLPLISGYRPGAMTSTGNKSYHGMGRAVDLPPRWDVFNWISQNYGRGTKELIFTPAGGRQIKNGQNHVFSGGTIAQDHYDHVHWAYDNGGQIAPNTPFINKTGSNELALNAAQGKALEDKIANSERPLSIAVYVDGVRRDAEIVVEEKFDQLIQALGGV